MGLKINLVRTNVTSFIRQNLLYRQRQMISFLKLAFENGVLALLESGRDENRERIKRSLEAILNALGKMHRQSETGILLQPV